MFFANKIFIFFRANILKIGVYDFPLRGLSFDLYTVGIIKRQILKEIVENLF